MKKKVMAFLLAAVMTFSVSVPTLAEIIQRAEVHAANGAVESVQYLQEETIFDGTENTRIAVSEEDLAVLKTLENISITVDFKTTSTGLMALAAVNGSTHTNDYISLYVNNGSRIGFELRNYTGSGATVNEHYYVDLQDINLANGKWHTITFILTKNEGYQIYLDKENVMEKAVSTTYFAGTDGWWEASSVTFGGANRITGNSYLYTGSLKNAKVYPVAISDEQVMEDHAHVEAEETPTAYPEGVYKIEEYGIYDMGDYDSYNYRIPALVTTQNNVVLAAADQRNTHWSDWGNIDTVIRRSTDHGLTWEDAMDVIDLKSQPYFTGTQSAFLIDPVLAATENGRVWMLVDMFPESTGSVSIDGTGTGYVEVDGADYLALYDAAGKVYTLRGSEVYDADGNKTSYTVDQGFWEDAYHSKGDLYDGETYVGNIYLKSKNSGNETAPLTVKRTCYLWLTYSDDDGKTWSNPVDITPQVKADWMQFCGVGPGVGIELKNGAHKGRIIFPIYYTIGASSGLGFQSSACIYSDDGGKTWTRGESPNDGRINSYGQPTSSQNPVGISQLTESQMIELSSGNLLQFMRNYGGAGKVAVARSTDGGKTWSDPINTSATEVYCQLSVLYMDQNGNNGTDRVLMSNPGGSGRNNGMLRIGEVTETEDSFSIQWVEEKLFCPGNYAYSCLTRMADGNFGLLYEHNNTIKFTAFNEAYIQEERNLLSPTISSVAYKIEKTDEHKFALPGDTYVFTVNVSQAITEVKGNPQLRFLLNGEAKYADFAECSANGKTLTFRYVIQEGDEGFISYRGPKVIGDEENYAKNEYGYQISAGDLEVSLGYIGTDPSDASRDIPVEVLKAVAGDSQSGEGPEMVLDGNSASTWHTDWYEGADHTDHWIQFELSDAYMVDGLRYQPRQSGTNGIITAFEILVSNDGETFTTAAKGTWEGNSAWKTVSFKAQKAKYVRLQTLDAMSDQAIRFASAAEIRLTGVREDDYVAPPDVKPVNPFTDIQASDFYYDPAIWAYNVGVTTGVTATTFVPGDGCTRGQIVTFLWRLAGAPKAETACPFTDVQKNSYYYDAILWAVEKGITNGTSETTFEPEKICTRAEIVTFLYRTVGKPEVTEGKHNFTDVNAKHFYYPAMLWAVENNVTTGVTPTTFVPDKDVTRGETVTFLYRVYKE